MSLEIKNLSINVSISSKSEEKKVDENSIKMKVLEECRHMIDDAISESRER